MTSFRPMFAKRLRVIDDSELPDGETADVIDLSTAIDYPPPPHVNKAIRDSMGIGEPSCALERVSLTALCDVFALITVFHTWHATIVHTNDAWALSSTSRYMRHVSTRSLMVSKHRVTVFSETGMMPSSLYRLRPRSVFVVLSAIAINEDLQDSITRLNRDRPLESLEMRFLKPRLVNSIHPVSFLAMTKLHTLKLSQREPMKEDGLVHLPTSLTALSVNILKGTQLRDNLSMGRCPLQRLTGLTDLTLYHQTLSRFDIRDLVVSMEHLRTLCLWGCWWTSPVDASTLSLATQLTSLSIDDFTPPSTWQGKQGEHAGLVNGLVEQISYMMNLRIIVLGQIKPHGSPSLDLTPLQSLHRLVSLRLRRLAHNTIILPGIFDKKVVVVGCSPRLLVDITHRLKK